MRTPHKTICEAIHAAGRPLTMEEVVVKAWELDRRVFGLRGFEQQYPNSRRVAESFYGDRGVLAARLIRKTDEGRYALTASGLDLVIPPEVAGTEPAPAAEHLPRVVQKALETEAYRLYSKGHKESVTFSLACEFWGMPGKAIMRGELGDRVELFDELLRIRDDQELRVLANCHGWLRDKFQRQIKVAS